MQKGDHLFVYGTLRRGEHADLRTHIVAKDVRFCGDDAITARLYHLGGFPGVKLINGFNSFDYKQPCVVGEVFRILHPSVVAVIDAYEGYDADNPSLGLYDRKEVETKSGQIAWVYIYNSPVVSDQLIESGDWCRSPNLSIKRRLGA